MGIAMEHDTYYESLSVEWGDDPEPFSTLEQSFFAAGDRLGTEPDPIVDSFDDLLE